MSPTSRSGFVSASWTICLKIPMKSETVSSEKIAEL